MKNGEEKTRDLKRDRRLKEDRNLEKTKSTLLGRREPKFMNFLLTPLWSLPGSPFLILIAHNIFLSFSWYSFHLLLSRTFGL